MNAEAVLELRGLSKLYGNRPVLDRVDLALRRGSVVGLLGKNGAGKTTLMRCALGLAKPDHGTARSWASRLELERQAKQAIGYVPQTPQLYPWMQVRHILEYVGSFYRKWNYAAGRAARARVANPAHAAGRHAVGGRIAEAVDHRRPGTRTRTVGTRRARGRLDPAARREFLKVVLDIAAGGQRSVLFSTHITSDLERVADHVAILQAGRITFFGELGELKDQIKRLVLTAEDALPERFNLPGVVRQRIEGRRALVTTRAVTPELVEELESTWDATVEVQDLNLEEIFLELHDE